MMGNALLSEGFIDFLTIFPMGKEKGIKPKRQGLFEPFCNLSY